MRAANFFEGVLILVLYFRYLNSREKALEILEIHPENAIITRLKIQLFLETLVPLVGLVTPLAGPLEVAPRVTELKQFHDLFLLILDPSGPYDAVAVLRDQASLV